MKSKILSVFVLALIFGEPAFTQGIYQEFETSGFSIECDCILEADRRFAESLKEQEVENFISAYQCLSFKEDPDKGTFFSINVFDESDFVSQFAAQADVFPFFAEKIYLHRFTEDLSDTDTDFINVFFMDLPAVEYKQILDEVTSKSIVFLLNKKSYLITVASNTDLDAKFTKFIETFRGL